MWSDGSLSVMTSLAFDGTIIVVAPSAPLTARRRRTPSAKEDEQPRMINDACGALPQSVAQSQFTHTVCPVVPSVVRVASYFSVFHASQFALPAAATVAASAAVVVHQYNEFVELNSCSDESESHLMMSAEAQKTHVCAHPKALDRHGD